MFILSRLHLHDLKIPKDTTKVAFIEYYSDKTVVFKVQMTWKFLLSCLKVLQKSETLPFTVF